MTPHKEVEVPEVLEVQVVPSDEVMMVPDEPTATINIDSVVNPVPVSYWLLKVLPDPSSLSPVVILILYVVDLDKPEEGVTVNVL